MESLIFYREAQGLNNRASRQEACNRDRKPHRQPACGDDDAVVSGRV